MMKKFVVVLMCVLMLALCGCENAEPERINQDNKVSAFVEVEVTTYWRVVYNKETKVMYAVSNGGYNGGTFTLLVNADGTPMVYGGEK